MTALSGPLEPVAARRFPKIFGVPMTLDKERSQVWGLTIGNWRLVVMAAVDSRNGFWWAVETTDQSTTIASNYRATPELGAKAIEEWLESIWGLIEGLQGQGRLIATELGR